MSNLNSAAAEALRLEQERLAIAKQLEAFNQRINEDFTGYVEGKRKLLQMEKDLLVIEQLKEELIDANNGHATELTRQLDRQLVIQRQLLQAQREQLRNANLIGMAYRKVENYSMGFLTGAIGMMSKFILDADKAWRSLNLTIGLSGKNSELLRQNLIDSAVYGAKLGLSFKDLTEIQGSYTEEMGRAVLLSEQNFKYLSQVAKGTKMGTIEAGKMAAKFNLIGKSVKSVRDFYEDTVNQAERFGLSANEVIKNINSNLEKSQQFVFKDGSEGLKKMAMYATKFKMDMGSVFSAMEKANGLEGAVDMAAQLQVIGGNFAKTDPFKLLFQARNDAEGFTKTMQGLTKGMYTFNRTTGELQINAGNLNRLKLAAEATGVPLENLIKQAQRSTQIDMMGGMLGGLSKESREFVESVAEIQKDGNFKVQVAPGDMRDIRSLSDGQVRTLMQANKSLEERARDAQAFDEVFLNTINELKSAALPILRVLGDATKFLSSSGWLKPMLTVGAGLLGFIGAMGFISKFTKTIALFIPAISKGGGLFGRLAGNRSGGNIGTQITQGAANTTGQLGQNIQQTGAAAGGAWKNMMAFGAAVTLIGAGVWLATNGIAGMANAFKGLNPEQLNKLNSTMIILGTTFGVLAAGMMVAGSVASFSAIPMLAFGGAVALIGAGIGLATAGIGYMAKGFGEMFDKLSQVTDPKVIASLGGLVMGLTTLSASLALFANPLSWVGLAMLGGTVSTLGDKLKELEFTNVSTGAQNFNKIATAIERINDKKLDKLIAVSEGLGAMGSITAMFSSLSNLFGDGIEVKFADDKVNLQIDITNKLDSKILTRELSKTIPLAINSSKKGGVN